MQLRAFAKINLDLRIAGRRDDGFHEVGTILQTIDWFDEIHFSFSDRFEFTTTDGPSSETNLVVRAVRGFEQLTRKTVALRIHLIKNIPIGSGLGGGSADAAVTFLGLQRLFRVELPDSEILEVLRGLGSDVPFFAVGGRAVGVGRGDEIFPLEDSVNFNLLLVLPGINIATSDAYSWLTMQDKPSNIEGFRDQFLSSRLAEQQENDFEGPVFARHTELADIKRELLGLGARRAGLSGTGSTIFGLFDRERDAREAASVLSKSFQVRLTNPLPRREYFQRMFADL